MLRYPQDFSRLEYSDYLTKQFKNKYPFFTHTQIAIPIYEMVDMVTSLLFETYLAMDKYEGGKVCLCKNVKLLMRIVDVSPEEFPMIRYRNSFPSIFIAINSLYKEPILPIRDMYKDSLYNVAIWLVREGECLDFLMTQEENYKTFLQEMIRQCVTEIAAVADANMPYEIKQEYEKDLLKYSSKDESISRNQSEKKRKKSVKWDNEQEKITTVPSRKRERHSYEKIDTEAKKQKKGEYREELKVDKKSRDEKYSYFIARYYAQQGCDMRSCCDKSQGCYRHQRNLGEMYEEGNDNVARNYFLAKFWYQKAANQGEEGAKVFLKKLSPSPYYPKQHSRFWQPIVEMPAESSQQGENQEIQMTETSLTLT